MSDVRRRPADDADAGPNVGGRQVDGELAGDLTPGTRLGPYAILEPLGAGRMGELHRARDTRLDRIVAIKVLPAHTAADPRARARLDREGRAIASLSHPNICALHDVGHDLGRDYLMFDRSRQNSGVVLIDLPK